MFKYGHMLVEGDKLYVAIKDGSRLTALVPAEVKDLWGNQQGNRWAEFWTFGEGQIARPLMIKRVTAHTHFTVFDGPGFVHDDEPKLQIGTPRPGVYSKF